MKTNRNKIQSLLGIIPMFLLLFLITSCDAIEGIFKAGMGFGILILIAVLVVIIGIVVKLGKK